VHLVGNPFAATIAARESAQVICRRDAVVTYRDTLYLYHRVASLSNDYGRSSPGLVQRSGQHDWWAGGECLTTYKRSMVDRGREDSRRTSSIQNPGVKRMSEMSSILSILLYREAPSPHEPK